MSFCAETKKHLAPTMLPGQLLLVELLKPPRLMLGQEALLFQGFPACPFLALVEEKHIDMHEQPSKVSRRKPSSEPKKWLTEALMTDLAGNAMALLAIAQSAIASLLFRPSSSAATAEETADALSALDVLSALGS